MDIYNYKEKGLETEIFLYGDSDVIRLKGKSLTNSIVKYRAKLFFLSGKILEDDLETLNLLKWCNVSSEKKEHLRKMVFRIVRNDYVVREIELNNIYAINHNENFSTNTYSLTLAQHNRGGEYISIPIDTECGMGQVVIQPKDDETRNFLNNVVLGLNSAGSLVVLNAGKKGLLNTFKTGASAIGGKMSFLARFNIYYLATHGTNLVISTSADIYFKSIGYEEGIGVVNPLKDIYVELSKLLSNGISKIRNKPYDEERAIKNGERLFYTVDLTGAITGAVGTSRAINSSRIYGKNISYSIKYSKEFTEAIRKYKSSYIILSGGALARDVNPIVNNINEMRK